MGNCVGTSKPGLRPSQADKFRSVVHERQYYLLRLIYSDLGSRIVENQVNLENFLLFFEKSGFWGDRLFKQFDVGASNLITEQEFIKGIVKIFKTSEDQKIELLFKFFSGSTSKTQGVGFPEFLTMLYNYPKQDFKKILNNEEFFNKELRKKLVATNNNLKGRRLDSLCISELSYNSNNGTTFRIDEIQCEGICDRLESKMESEILKDMYQKGNAKSTTFKVQVGQAKVEVATTNIHYMVKKFAMSIFKSYNINIHTGNLQFEQFRDWMMKHKQLYDDYYKGFHSQIWQINKSTLRPLFSEKLAEFSSPAHIYLSQTNPKKVFISLLHSVLLVLEQRDPFTPISIVCMDGLSAKKMFQADKGYGIEITHRDQIYQMKRFYLKDEALADQWMEFLKFYKGCSIAMLYEMGEKIGVGKFSVVYNAKENQTGQKYAIKVIESSRLEQQARKLIAHESSIMSIVSHPMLVSFKESIQTKTTIYIVTELVQGKDLYEFVKDSHILSESEAAFVVKQIIVGVRYLHSLGIVHRDLKPENIMIQFHQQTKQIGKIKIIDFGFANYLESIRRLPPEQALAGTPNYIAPESLRLEPITEKVDNFSIGSILYFALSGGLAFGARKINEVFENTLNGAYQLNDKRWKSISNEAKDLVKRLLDNDPVDRISLDEALAHPWLTKFQQNVQQLEPSKLDQTQNSMAHLR